MPATYEIKQKVKRLAQKFGIRFFTDASLPTGVDWLLDIKKMAGRGGRPPQTLFDVGANIGQTTIEMSHAFPKARIYAFEPFRSTFENLQKRTAHLPHAKAFQLALGAQPGSMEVSAQENSVFNSLLYANRQLEGEASTQSVTIETLDHFCNGEKLLTIDVLKTDTEGFDLEVLRGADQLLTDGHVGFVYTEVTFSSENIQNTAFFPLYEFLTAKNFRCLGLYETYPIHHAPDPLSFCNALFVSRSWL